MKNILKKKSGFTLIEVIMSIAIIAILSVGIYNGYILLIKFTKSGEVKQSISISAKKDFENINSSIILKEIEDTLSFNLGSENIELSGNINNEKVETKLYLDSNYNIIENENGSRYTETISIDKVKGKIEETNSYVSVDLDKKISYIKDPLNIEVNNDNIKNDIFNIIFKEDDEGNKKVNTYDYKDNIILDLNNISSNDIKIIVYNETEDKPNIYIKSKENLNIEFIVLKGTVSKKIYGSYNEEKSILCNITIKIFDNNDNNCIFEGINRVNVPIAQN